MNPLTEASREIMWNISHAWIMYLLFALALAAFGWGFYRRAIFWLRGKGDRERFSDWGKRLIILLREVFLQKRVRGSRFPAVFHSLIFYSFLGLVVTTTFIALDYDFGTNFFTGYLYVLLTVVADLAGLLILIGVGMAIYRRWIIKPKTLENTFGDAWSLAIIGLIVITGFLIEGLRIALIFDPWSHLSPVGLAASYLFTGITEQGGRTAHVVLWWTHTVLAMAWIATIPFTKFFHMLALPMNIFFSKLTPRGSLQHPDIAAMLESDDPLDLHVGIEKASDFTWKQRLDFDACINCGRCEEVCPAYLANQPFSPRKMIANLTKLTREYANNNENGNKEPPALPEDQTTDCADDMQEKEMIVGNALDEDFIWYCRTCTACMDVCPALIEHADTLIEMRRNEVLIQGRMPPDAQRALKTLESLGNPFGPQDDRIDWINELDVPIIGPGQECDVIYWIGCCTTFDPSKQKIAADLCRILKKCGINFGVLGSDERCCGDPARVLGQEHLFREIAMKQIEDIKSRKFRVLLTSCPHCYNVLKNEYSQFGGDFHVVHHSEFLHEMIWRGILQPVLGIEGRYVYHDPCYLGRYQKIYQAPREVIKSVPGTELVEMENTMSKSLCCGGGGGHYWMDLKVGERLNNLRVQQAIDARAETIVTGCAYCMQMLDDSVKIMNQDENIRVVDMATLIMESLEDLEIRTIIDEPEKVAI
jgi:Fe-S oxidoreductase/nitrate reductase gamma subunit